MKHFLKKIFLLGAITLVAMYVIMFIQRNYVWQITNSISMDAKLWYADKMDIQDIDIIGLGSSMTLNNLNTEAVLEGVSSEKKIF